MGEKMMSGVFVRLARLKNYFSQGNLYMAVANFVITIATWQAAAHSTLPLWLLFFGGFGAVVLVGAFDFYFIKRHEIQHQNTMNDMKEQLNRIEQKVNT